VILSRAVAKRTLYICARSWRWSDVWIGPGEFGGTAAAVNLYVQRADRFALFFRSRGPGLLACTFGAFACDRSESGGSTPPSASLSPSALNTSSPSSPSVADLKFCEGDAVLPDLLLHLAGWPVRTWRPRASAGVAASAPSSGAAAPVRVTVPPQSLGYFVSARKGDACVAQTIVAHLSRERPDYPSLPRPVKVGQDAGRRHRISGGRRLLW
jgi:hypothetical protein